MGGSGYRKSFCNWFSKDSGYFGEKSGDLLTHLEDIFQILPSGVS